MILNKLTPDYYFHAPADIPEGFFAAHGIKAVLCDIDNTLVTYDDPTPTPSALSFFDRLRGDNVAIAFISNNTKERVEIFNQSLGVFAVGKAGKPHRRTLREAMSHIGVIAAETAVLGDQIFTDVYAGKRLGLTAILVDPIKDKTSLFFRIKRRLERGIKKRYYKKQLQKTQTEGENQ